jgi:hypothetical protein
MICLAKSQVDRNQQADFRPENTGLEHDPLFVVSPRPDADHNDARQGRKTKQLSPE